MLLVGIISARILYVPYDGFDKSRNISYYNIEYHNSKYNCDCFYSSVI